MVFWYVYLALSHSDIVPFSCRISEWVSCWSEHASATRTHHIARPCVFMLATTNRGLDVDAERLRRRNKNNNKRPNRTKKVMGVRGEGVCAAMRGRSGYWHFVSMNQIVTVMCFYCVWHQIIRLNWTTSIVYCFVLRIHFMLSLFLPLSPSCLYYRHRNTSIYMNLCACVISANRIRYGISF